MDGIDKIRFSLLDARAGKSVCKQEQESGLSFLYCNFQQQFQAQLYILHIPYDIDFFPRIAKARQNSAGP